MRSIATTLARHPNVTVDGAGSVLDMIQNAAAVIHLNCGTAVEAVLLGKLPVELNYLHTPTTAGHALLPARVSRAANSFDELVDIVDHLREETAKFDFAGIHAANIEAFFYRNDGMAAERVAEVLTGTNRTPRPFVSLSNVIRGTRPNPSAGQIAKGLASLVFGSALTERLRARFDPARRDKRIEPSVIAGLLERIAIHDGREPSLFTVNRARCAKTGLPLASIAIERQPVRT